GEVEAHAPEAARLSVPARRQGDGARRRSRDDLLPRCDGWGRTGARERSDGVVEAAAEVVIVRDVSVPALRGVRCGSYDSEAQAPAVHQRRELSASVRLRRL